MRNADSHSVADVAQRYAVGGATVLHWIREGELKAVNVSRSARSKRPTWRITEAALAAFEAARTPGPPVPKTRRNKQPSEVVEFYK